MPLLIKTAAGRAEIRQRSLPLSRAGRNLLLIMDDSRDSTAWVEAIKGCTAVDLQMLLDGGLVAPVPGSQRAQAPASAAQAAPAAGTPRPPAAPAATPAAAPQTATGPVQGAPAGAPVRTPTAAQPAAAQRLATAGDWALASSLPPDSRMHDEAALDKVPRDLLYTRLTAEARPALGLMAGYRAVLALERAADEQAVRRVAATVVAQVRVARGEAAAQALVGRLTRSA